MIENEEKNRDIFIIENQQCPVCSKDKATISEYEIEDPFSGKISIFAIKCNSCGFKNSDLEFIEPKPPREYTLIVQTKEDLNIRIIKSGDSEIKIPELKVSVDSTMNSSGFISNVEGVINRFKKQIDFLNMDSELSRYQKKKIKNILFEIKNVLEGKKKITLKLIDKSGNSSIISDKVIIKKIKK